MKCGYESQMRILKGLGHPWSTEVRWYAYGAIGVGRFA